MARNRLEGMTGTYRVVCLQTAPLTWRGVNCIPYTLGQARLDQTDGIAMVGEFKACSMPKKPTLRFLDPRQSD